MIPNYRMVTKNKKLNTMLVEPYYMRDLIPTHSDTSSFFVVGLFTNHYFNINRYSYCQGSSICKNCKIELLIRKFLPFSFVIYYL